MLLGRADVSRCLLPFLLVLTVPAKQSAERSPGPCLRYCPAVMAHRELRPWHTLCFTHTNREQSVTNP